MATDHKKQWNFLEKKNGSNQLSHSYLFAGAKEIGKKTFAVEFAKLLNCKNENPPCQKCFSCQAIEKNSFPDLLIVKSANSISSIKNKKDSLEIDISQIRDVQNFLSYKSYYGSFKIVIVEDAEKMNQEAQSCFLKTLEEPKGKTLLILISSKPDMLLPTIISRCQAIKFFKPKNLQANPERLEKEREILNDLLPVIGSDFAQKFKYVKSIDFEKKNAGDILEVMQKYLRHLLMVKIGTEESSGKDENFKKYSVKDLQKILNLVEDISRKLTFSNANPKLALEILLIEM